MATNDVETREARIFHLTSARPEHRAIGVRALLAPTTAAGTLLDWCRVTPAVLGLLADVIGVGARVSERRHQLVA